MYTLKDGHYAKYSEILTVQSRSYLWLSRGDWKNITMPFNE